jgi:type IV secretion system protein VirD4
MSFIKLFQSLKTNTIFHCAAAIVIILELISSISFFLLGRNLIPTPWSWFFLVRTGYAPIVLIAITIIVIVASILYLYAKTGIYRWYSWVTGCALFLLLASGILGLIIFKVWSGMIGSITPAKLIGLFYELQISPDIYNKFMISEISMLGSCSLIVLFYFFNKYSPDKRALGDAHFSSALEIKKAGFFDEEGIVVGKSWGKALKVGGFEHVLSFAPAGSGKTASIAIPNLLQWESSCVVNDPKYELFETTSGHRENVFNNEVFCWAPTRTKTHRYNPLEFISCDPHKRIGEIQLMGHVMMPNGKQDPIWYQSSRQLFLALVLYLLDHPDKKATLPEVYLLSKQKNFNGWLSDVLENTTNFDPEFYRNVSSYLSSPEKTRGSILTTFSGYLEIFANPVINAATSDSDFDLRSLRKKRITIYIGFSEHEKELISPLLTLFWQQLISFMTEQVPDEKIEPYPLLCLMEEFSILGRLVNLKSSLKILRGYRVRVLIIIQYLAQTLENYSRAEAEAFKNIKTKIAFSLDSQEDAEYVSRILGPKTKRITSRGHSMSENGSSSSKNQQLQAVPLMRPAEIQRLKPNKAIIIKTGHPPVMAKQYRWYKQKSLKNLPCGVTEIPEQTPIIAPFERGDSEKIICGDETTKNIERDERNLLKKIQKEENDHEIFKRGSSSPAAT